MNNLVPLSFEYKWTLIIAECFLEALALFLLYFSTRSIAERSPRTKFHVGVLTACLAVVLASVAAMYGDYTEMRDAIKYLEAPRLDIDPSEATPERRAKAEFLRTGKLSTYRDLDGVERIYTPTQTDLDIRVQGSELLGVLRRRAFRTPIEIARAIVLTCTFVALGLILGLRTRRGQNLSSVSTA
jgi:hypothetical protein